MGGCRTGARPGPGHRPRPRRRTPAARGRPVPAPEPGARRADRCRHGSDQGLSRMAGEKLAVLLLDLQNITDSAARLRAEVTADEVDWDEELFAKVRDLRQEIINQ